jgi:L-2-hydroxyglutarate oxidase LhgO
MARRYWRIGLGELHRAFSQDVFIRDLQRLVPEITAKDVEAGGAGVRAQALSRRGDLLDDFNIQVSSRAVHVLNAPSPGATSSLAIGEHIADLARDAFGLD